MTENTLENKAKFFALYLNQKVLDTSLHGTVLSPKWIDRILNDECDGSLILKPLFSITDEDAETVGELFHKADMLLSPDNLLAIDIKTVKEEIEGLPLITPIADYLRSRGYLVEWMGLAPDEIVSYGWVEIKEDKP